MPRSKMRSASHASSFDTLISLWVPLTYPRTFLLSWADTFDEAKAETKHMIIARLVERIEINHDYEVEIKFRISVEQYMRIAA